MGRADVLGELAQALLPLVVFPQVHLPPWFVLLGRLTLEVTLAVALPKLIRVLPKPLRGKFWGKIIKYNTIYKSVDTKYSAFRKYSYPLNYSTFCCVRAWIQNWLNIYFFPSLIYPYPIVTTLPLCLPNSLSLLLFSLIGCQWAEPGGSSATWDTPGPGSVPG